MTSVYRSTSFFLTSVRCILIFSACPLASITIAAPGAITPPEKEYHNVDGAGRRIIATSIDELIAKMNARSSDLFEVCTSKPVYSCVKSVVTHAEGSDIFGWINGENIYYSLHRYNHSKNKDAKGVVRTSDSPSGTLGASVHWTCPKGYSKRSESIGPNSSRVTCVIAGDTFKNKGPSNDSCPAPSPVGGNPINFSVGNKYQHEVDHSMSGIGGMEFSRAYNSLDGIWRHNFSMRLDVDLPRNQIYLTRETGKLTKFSLNNGVVTPEAIELGTLTSVNDQWVYIAANNDRFTFDSNGLLVQQKILSGVERNLTRTQGTTIVVDNFGRSLEFTEDESGQPLHFQSGPVQGSYSYNSDNRLISVDVTISGATKARNYHYEDSRDTSLLTGITDERGVRYVTWTYDDKGRAISSEHFGGAEKIQISYDSASATSVTNELGKVTKYTFRDISGLKRISSIVGEPSANCPNSNSSFSYNSRGQLTSKTDNMGHKTNYSYNTRGLESSRTEAYGTPQSRTITTEWHPTFFLPTVVTEPKRIIRYQYDTQGRQLSRTIEAR